MLLAGIAVEGAAFSFDREFDYIIPDSISAKVLPGCRVTVPFGKGSKKRLGIVLSVFEGEKRSGLKSIAELLDEQPLFDGEMTELVRWLKERTFCTLYEAAKAMLPSGMNHKMLLTYTVRSCSEEEISELDSVERALYEFLFNTKGYVKKEKIVKNLGQDAADALDSLLKNGIAVCNTDAVRNVGDASLRMLELNPDCGNMPKLTAKQKTVTDVLADVGSASVREICYYTGVTPAVPGTLVKNGVCRYVDVPIYRLPTEEAGEPEQFEIELTEEQQKAYEHIASATESGEASVSLLYGVTGSGKTSVYLKAIDKVAEMGKDIIVMVPEISLTPQTLSLFRKRYGRSVAVFHSALSAGERLDEWKRVRDGKAHIIVGTRSAVFAPVKSLGLIIIDEEQEHTYKSESSPRYSAIEVAKFRAAKNNCPLVLASATPSVETYANAVSGRYSLLKLTKRYGNAKLPEVVIVDLLREPMAPGCHSISQRLYDALSETLDAGRQAILLINRRGYNTFVACTACGSVVTCPNCSISMTYHNANGRLMCHYCGYSIPFTTKCPTCGEESVRYSGFGTQKIEDDLGRLFPFAKILRMDADTTAGKDSHEKLFKQFSDGDYDIMIGTQMVAKGLNFESVTLVGVISVDQQLFNDDFRSVERTFSLLTQVVGRSGRGEFAGKAVIQTASPENDVIRLGARQDYDAFYNTEIGIRRSLIYPPFCDLCVIGCVGENEMRVKQCCAQALLLIENLIKIDYAGEKIIVLGPMPARVQKVSGKFRHRLIIKCRNSKRFRAMISEVLVKLGSTSAFSAVTLFADINPENIM